MKQNKMVTAAAAVADLGKMPTLGKGPKEVLNELGLQVGCNVTSSDGTRGVYKIVEIRKPIGKPVAIVLELVAKTISIWIPGE